MNQNIACDIAIIGGGSAGLSLAAGASQLGADVVLIESGKMGGDCLNYGCVPSKALIAAAKACYHMQEAAYFGAQTNALSIDFSKVMAHVQQVIETIAEHDSVARFESLGVRVIQAAAQFTDKRTLVAGEHTIQAKRFVVATGSFPFVPPIPGLNGVPYLTNETIFNLQVLPKQLLVIGGGPIGCELAQAFAMLGSEVTILEAFKILPHDDPDCVQVVRDSLRTLGITIYESAEVQSVELSQQDKLVAITIKHDDTLRIIHGSNVLVAAGRRANVGALQLEKAGVVFSEKGISVDARLRTRNKKIYAMGDVVGALQFTHIANYHAGVVLRNILFRLPAKVGYSAVPWVTYTSPELAHVGLTAAEACKQKGLSVFESSFMDNDRAQAEHKTKGIIKIITDNRARVLGVTIVGAQAGELILPWVMVVREKKTLRSFTDIIVPYPTLGEISKRVAGDFYKPKLFSKRVRTLVRFLLKLG